MNENKMKEVPKFLNVKLEEVFLPKPILDDVEKEYLSNIIKPLEIEYYILQKVKQ